MRADRLVACLLILQAKGRVTALELAEELEISERTARRDLEALAIAGLPVYSQPGRGGGWSLLGGARTDLTGLTAAESRTLFLVAGPSSSATPEVKAALRKLVQALPETFRADAESAASAVVLDPTSWGYDSAPPQAHLNVLQQATVDGFQVRLGYTARDRNESERMVHPLGLVAKRSVWYLVAGTDAGMRTFRLSRIRSVVVTDRPVERPEGFDLAEAWKSVVDEVDQRRSAGQASPVVARADPDLVPLLRMVVGSRLTVGDVTPDGRVEVEVVGDSVESTAGELAGFGARIEVLEPRAVRDRLALLGAELSRCYGSSTGSAPATGSTAVADPTTPADPTAATSQRPN
ncbi:MAG TPA: YafY family protein [Acidimicrobiales bacterium]|nr:YafY family protein [Acidimicrobiales bacterium]